MFTWIDAVLFAAAATCLAFGVPLAAVPLVALGTVVPAVRWRVAYLDRLTAELEEQGAAWTAARAEVEAISPTDDVAVDRDGGGPLVTALVVVLSPGFLAWELVRGTVRAAGALVDGLVLRVRAIVRVAVRGAQLIRPRLVAVVAGWRREGRARCRNARSPSPVPLLAPAGEGPASSGDGAAGRVVDSDAATRPTRPGPLPLRAPSGEPSAGRGSGRRDRSARSA